MYIETAAIATIAGVIVKLADYIYDYIKKKLVKDEESKLREKVDNLVLRFTLIEDILSKTDGDGTYLVYTPRRLGAIIDEQNNLTRSLVHSSENISRAIEKLTSVTEGVIRILDRIEVRTEHLDR